ncbi:homeobox protein 30, ZINC FINGER HOMEODOMAIN 8, ZINC FINGER HOMEODOMAIN 3 [Hibiscus trionum]|uniref:Homeobox protein 30, ZINC FINGER HOMEODOMAIN 8, ZINC FINGER HOMEODOMAIN 3 n=1 Tax=Hibiscus trionum TaxID=183268 RepID=A0A9W7MA95_HIBTR|nr:homeobox protein 30, ZINC FINGER HOMEODOMAIN 8, ZINC FINGER HOMEODOMAIN 3 [Hibiscus trionum]
MEISPTSTTPVSTTTKSPEPESETPSQVQPAKPISFTNGVLKRHKPQLHHPHNPHAPPIVVTYKECLKNHAATLGGHALDGCGEFMPSPTSTPTDPTSLKCAACGCHRNFHRREPEPDPPPTTAIPTLEYLPQHRHHPPPPPPVSTHNSASPPPISSSYYPSGPHVLLALSGGLSTGALDNTHLPSNTNTSNLGSNSKKRFRTKFSQLQKEKMLEFAEKIGWRIQKKDEQLIQEFCNEAGVHREVLKVWMHNNKNTFGKKDQTNNIHTGLNNQDKNNGQNLNPTHHFETHACVAHIGTNGSSSSS